MYHDSGPVFASEKFCSTQITHKLILCWAQRWAKLLILVDFDVDIDNILEIDVEFDVWSDFDFGIEYCQANLQMLKLSTNLDMQLLNLEFES